MKIIEAKNIGKKYNINHQRTGYITLRDTLTNIFVHPFIFLKNKAKEVLFKKEEFWALKGVNFEVERGEVIGIIGRNGAGKSTLLKILSQITPPTEGEIRINGTVGSLLEVGTGFHPELTGRENIFLNGAILGMKKKDIVKNFDAIVEFAGIEKFLDTPVKYYSSGMYVRLAFSVAAHMNTDILIIDEVLAVGDAEFQKKCLGKMEEITKKEGRTILFVSHNMEAIKQLCNNIILLDAGKIKMIGGVQESINQYLNENNAQRNIYQFEMDDKKIVKILSVEIENSERESQSFIDFNKGGFIKLTYIFRKEVVHTIVSIDIISSDGVLILQTTDSDKLNKIEKKDKGTYCSLIPILPKFLNPGIYKLSIAIHNPGFDIYDIEDKIQIEIVNSIGTNRGYYQGKYMGYIFSPIIWDTNKKE